MCTLASYVTPCFFVQNKFGLNDKMFPISCDNCISYLFVENLRTISVSDLTNSSFHRFDE